VIAPETSAAEAGGLALRLEAAVQRVVARNTNLTASTGYAIYPDDGRSADALIGTADDSLKREKRNRRALKKQHERSAASLVGPSPIPVPER
jgi:GGDEF domain-containing protein